MLRLRRYRIFLILAVFTIFFLYHFTNVRDWDSSSKISVDGLGNFGQNGAGVVPPTSIAKAAAPKASPAVNTIKSPSPSTVPTIPDEVPVAKAPEVSPSTQSVASHATQVPAAESTSAPKIIFIPPPKVEEEEFAQTGQGRLEVEPVENAPPRAHWTKQEEHFPLPSESLISLPTGKPKDIPKIQHVFAEESAEKKTDRERRLASVREAFQTTWSSYRQYAWMNDELSPVSGGSRNPFCGWAATLVDSLDTLWIMGLKEEFEIATNAVQSINFTVSLRKDIPLFETVIRYLGGLIAAYDLSDGQYKALLEKAVELADILMGAFDTPNRMPQTFYNWAP
jgi:mannosyl-oligosaccharide alpha-1,2-mannosidase